MTKDRRARRKAPAAVELSAAAGEPKKEIAALQQELT
jgi:hypothetical protein